MMRYAVWYVICVWMSLSLEYIFRGRDSSCVLYGHMPMSRDSSVAGSSGGSGLFNQDASSVSSVCKLPGSSGRISVSKFIMCFVCGANVVFPIGHATTRCALDSGTTHTAHSKSVLLL